MGYTSYCLSDRNVRSQYLGYKTKSSNDIFIQNNLKIVHNTMNPKGITFRECRDSINHPNSFPIILTLDVTGSMRKIPQDLIKDGLPNIMSNLLDKGINDSSILFLAIGDHINDSYPLQVGQFESGDKELDLWLTRTYLEGRGGANNGESYMLSWYFAAFKTKLDSLEKRNKKGILFTIGDEPCLNNLPKRAIEEITGDIVEKDFTDIELLNEAKKMYDVYHLHVLEGEKGKISIDYWYNLLGQNCVPIDDFKNIPNVISDIILNNYYNNFNSNSYINNDEIIL